MISNDNVNLINNFNSNVENLKNIEKVSNDLNINYMRSVDVY